MSSDRIFGLVATILALTYIVSATQTQASFLTDPVGPKGFPILIGIVWAISGLFMVLRPDQEPDWPVARTFLALAFAVIILIGYAFALKPFGFLLPTAVAAGILSYQISPKPKHAALAGIGLSAGLFMIFKFALGLGLVAFPKGLLG
ncbi:tripartite tricarboxylate transporter TctB family protein [Desulfosarcina sp.]|uniref:tripartite tricarboxylate transporter TctB family protein n=1 Tax=Desulfosarcina sp. TaxID=2027861 RepID=UPI0029BD82D7|nr:tripartite tricarboxylate transporter TctB family protein [Desulfosarcina sp.]MDX2452786.1 tripartite tricarboxylate transporter TctB family protein [Desulfosarcina sp.]